MNDVNVTEFIGAVKGYVVITIDEMITNDFDEKKMEKLIDGKLHMLRVELNQYIKGECRSRHARDNGGQI